MNIPRDFIDSLLARIDIVDLINTEVPLQKKSGNNYFARCPFHNEKSASFSVSQHKQFYYCFGCGAHGNAIDFIMQYEHLNFPEAIESLARFSGLEIPQTAGTQKKPDNHPALYSMLEKATAFYYDAMAKSQRAIHYLKERGISGATAKTFRLGYALPGWSHLLDALGATEADKKKLLETGLIISKPEGGYYDRFRDRILFPIHDYRGRVIGFGGRVIDQGEPKYLNSPETQLFQKGHELYGLFQARTNNRQLDRIIIVEGYMDVIALYEQGITYAVATLGTATTQHHLKRILRYTSELIFAFDGDEAGRTAAWRALQVVLPMMHDRLQVRFLFLPEGEDPDSLVRKEGKLSFEKRLAEAISLSAFFFQTLMEDSDIQTMEGRAQFASRALEYLKQLPAGIYQGILLEELSKRARVNLSELKQQVTQADAGLKTLETSIATSSPQKPKSKLLPPLRMALALLIQHPALALEIDMPIQHTNLPGSLFLSNLIEIIKKSPHITTGGLIENWRGQKEEKFIAKLAHWEHMIPEKGVKSELLGALRQLLSIGFDEEINRLLAKAAQGLLKEDEKQALTEWISKKKALSTQYR